MLTSTTEMTHDCQITKTFSYENASLLTCDRGVTFQYCPTCGWHTEEGINEAIRHFVKEGEDITREMLASLIEDDKYIEEKIAELNSS